MGCLLESHRRLPPGDRDGGRGRCCPAGGTVGVRGHHASPGQGTDVSGCANRFGGSGDPYLCGKVPNKLLPWLQSGLWGNGALAVAVVVFGNRSYDNSLAELCATLEGDGFHTAAAGAFVAQHAFTDELAYGRPSWSDLFEAKSFAAQAADKVRQAAGVPEPVRVPGDPAAPYYVPKGTDGQPAKFLKAKPKTKAGRCNGAAPCVRMCPMGAIDPQDPSNVPGTCIKCQACVRKCTKQAKYFDDEAFLSHVAMLEAHFKDPKENENFL